MGTAAMQRGPVLVAACSAWWMLAAAGDLAAQSAHFTTGAKTAVRFGVHEIVLAGDGAVENPFDTLATVTFVPPSGERQAKTVHAFYDGENTWRARVYVSEPGHWKWTSHCASDKRLAGQSGQFPAADSQLRGRLLPHPKNPRQWMTENGRWFLNLNDTAYFLLCKYDATGKPIPEEDARAYVRDAVARGITSFRSFAVLGPRGFLEEGGPFQQRWRDAYFTDDGLSRLATDHFRVADERLRWLLDAYPDVYLQFILFPMGCRHGTDQVVWQTFRAEQKERVLRYMIARYAAFPQLFWLSVNDAHYGEKFPHNNAYAREVGAWFRRHDPWQHPFSAGHARKIPFAFGDEEWASYIHLEHAHDLAAEQAPPYYRYNKPIFLGEDRYEQDHAARLDPRHMDYWQRRLFWSWLLAAGSTNYGGRWWAIHPYSQTGSRPTARPNRPDIPFTAALTGLDSVKPIRDYFSARKIELSDFQPDDLLVKDTRGANGIRAPKLARRERQEFLIYHPHAATDGQDARADEAQTAAVEVDLRQSSGAFSSEWYRCSDGEAAAGQVVEGGAWRELTAPWKGCDCVLRLKQQP